MSEIASSNRSKTRRRVAVITGSRAEYGLLKTVMQAISRHPALRLQTIVTGMHLLPKFGKTVCEIEADGWKIDAKIKMQRGDDDPLDQARGLSRGIIGIGEALQALRTQIVVVLGDRIEAMAGALAAVATGRFLAHIHGGDIANGDIDDSLRHSITKLAHLHLTATPSAAQRIMQMGESRERVHVVGAPGLDRLRQLRELSNNQKIGKLKRNDQDCPHCDIFAGEAPNALIVHHSCGRKSSIEQLVMDSILGEVQAAGLTTTCVFPNTDRGHSGIIAAIKEHAKRTRLRCIQFMESLGREEFLRLLLEADVLIGNSSCGIIEAPAAGTPVVNVGSRQDGRERGGNAIIDCDENAASIRRAIQQALELGPITPAYEVYGDGHAGKRIAEHLATMPLTDAFRRKLFADPAMRDTSVTPHVQFRQEVPDLMPV